MIHTYKFFKKKTYPAYLEDSIETLSKACDAVFADKKDLLLLCVQVQNDLKEKLPRGEKAYVRVNVDAKGHGVVELYATIHNFTQAVMWFDFDDLKAVLDYDPKAGDFFDISEEVENLFTKGGEA